MWRNIHVHVRRGSRQAPESSVVSFRKNTLTPPLSFVPVARLIIDSLDQSQNKKGEAPQQSKKEESKKNKRARYAADNQKTVLERQQVRTPLYHGHDKTLQDMA